MLRAHGGPGMADRRHCALRQLKSHAWQATFLGQPLYLGVTLHADIAPKPRLITLATQSEKETAKNRGKFSSIHGITKTHVTEAALPKPALRKLGNTKTGYYLK